MAITIALLTHNNGSTIGTVYDSIVAQLQPEDEVLVADMGSTDRTLFHLAAYHDPRMRILTGFSALKPNLAWAAMHAQAQNELLFLADGFTAWLPQKKGAYEQALQSATLVTSDSIYASAAGNTSWWAHQQVAPGLWSNLNSPAYLPGAIAYHNHRLPSMPDLQVEVGTWLGSYAAAYAKVMWLNQPFQQLLAAPMNAESKHKHSKWAMLKLLLKYR